MEELTMKQLEERQLAEREELRLQIYQKALKETTEKIPSVKNEMVTHAKWLKEIAESIIKYDNKVDYDDIGRLQQQTEFLVGWIRKVLETKSKAKDLRKTIKNCKKYNLKFKEDK